MFSPNLTKRQVEAAWVPDSYAEDLLNFERWREDVENALDSELPEDVPEETEGIALVRFREKTQVYGFQMTAGEFLEWKGRNFDTKWLMDNFPMDTTSSGGWGWPQGRTEGSGWWEGRYVPPKGRVPYVGVRKPTGP